jgi:5-methylthioadenosine/S-adenosylhomocysteine deaminase
MADQLDLRVQIHLHETAAEVENSLSTTGMRPIQRLKQLGLVNASLLAVHAVHVNDEEIELLAESNVAVAHCPRSNLKLASGIAPLVNIRDAGITVGLGTDGAASNNTLDLLSEASSAALLAKVRSEDAAALDANDALELATLGSARALGLEASIGSIVPGKWADLTCIDLSRLNSQPMYDPVSQLIYAVRADQVSDVWVAGKHLLESGELTHMSADDLVARATEWRERIAKTGHQE